MYSDENYSQTPAEKSSSSGLAAFFRGVLRLILVLLFGLVLGIAIYYFGSYYFYWQTIKPANDSAARLEVIETLQAQGQGQAETRLSQFNQRLTELEKQSLNNTEMMAELQIGMKGLQQSIENHTSALERLDQLEGSLIDLESKITINQGEFSALQKTLTSENAPLAELNREVRILKVLELLSRSRLFLGQNNLGLAQEDILNARQILLILKMDTPDDKQVTLDLWIQRLDMALANLPQAPVLASDDLDIVWRQLVKGFSGGADIKIEATSAAHPSPSITPQPTEVLPTATPGVSESTTTPSAP